MATITSTGVGSGLDVESIVSQLMALEKRPLNLLQKSETSLQTKLSAIGQLTSYTSAMKDAANAMSSVLLWKQTAATSADTSSVTVSTETGATVGNYAVRVQQLAGAQTVSSQVFSSSKATFGTGTLKIELGSWTGEPTPTGFNAKSGSTPVTLTIGEGEDTLEKIRDKINASKTGVTASIINDASGARLALRSTETGAENAFRITATETTDDGDAATGLSALAYSATATSPMTRNQTAVNALATINGIAVSSSNNTLKNIADGMTLTLNKVTTSDVAVAVTADDDAVLKAVDTFVSAFNTLAGYIKEQTKYDETAKSGGTLQGDRTTGNLLMQLRGVINEGSTASSVYSRLSDIGISMDANGLLEVKDTKLKNALTGNRDELRKLFAADGSDSASSGFMDRFRDLGNIVLSSEGLLTSRSDGLKNQIETNDKSQTAMETRLALTEARIRRQYQALDASMASLSGLSNYVSQQLTALNNSNN
ncbi:flagellar filament capping protein FliD [Rubrivivax gelatinosus]|uniref:Flagellar hook-associated protein 2 n=1 Tax=Rubrivivax gelatinosus TaxID=28068 RepID=A0ABS1DTB2_RUBGE|nr:flagellar filament capping protein FliD [Rubrivivax gelatinosus]MBK1712946.1 flagellar hook protein [Rubrivivax gelatinosus]